MANNEQILTEDDFEKLTQRQYFDLWYVQGLNYKKIGKMYNVDPKRVRAKRKELGLTYLVATYLGIGLREDEKVQKRANKQRR